jgi:hypothetical protein
MSISRKWIGDEYKIVQTIVCLQLAVFCATAQVECGYFESFTTQVNTDLIAEIIYLL